jgi:hypothetical protein
MIFVRLFMSLGSFVPAYGHKSRQRLGVFVLLRERGLNVPGPSMGFHTIAHPWGGNSSPLIQERFKQLSEVQGSSPKSYCACHSDLRLSASLVMGMASANGA